MKIKDILENKNFTLSYEVFPPKSGASFEPVKNAVDDLCKFSPDFMSVTYGAGGGVSSNTVKIASEVQKNDVTALAHLTCVSSTRDEINKVLFDMKKNNIQNILALRGDKPENSDFVSSDDYKYAYELVKEIKAYDKDFCVGAACYPEGHTECQHKEDDIDNLKLKVETGVDFLITQMFFDNNILYNYLYRTRAKGITVPVIAGIMPVTNGKQIARICKLSGTYLPMRFKAIVDKFGDNPKAMAQAGIAYATEQIIDLISNGVDGVHIYTMNKPYIAESIKNNLKYIIEEANGN